MVGVYTRQRRTFTDDNIHFLQSSANVLGMAMERKRLEGELLARLEQLADTDKRKDEFLAMLAHELRNPLAPIRNAMHLVRLRGQERRQVVREAYDIIERQIEHLVRLVDDLLDVSRITRGKIQLHTELIDLATIVARAIEGSRPLIDARQHTLEVVLPAAPVPVEADPLRLAQVLWNLLNNAAKYTPEGGRIVLTVEREARRGGGDEAVVRMRDTGVGIPTEMLPKVFDLFTQMERTLERSEGGLGIGLTLVRRLAELHGGTVQAFSKGTGQGSEFVVRLPALPAGPLADPPQKPGARSDGERLRLGGAFSSWTTTGTRPRVWRCYCGCSATTCARPMTDGSLWNSRPPTIPMSCCWTSAYPAWMAWQCAGTCVLNRREHDR